MRKSSLLVLSPAVVALVAVAAAADDPAPLLKPVEPAGKNVRVRIPFHTENKYTDSQFQARVPRAKAKGGAPVAVTVALDTVPGRGAVSAKKWKSWGYAIPADRVAVLPEVVFKATQLGAKAGKGRPAEVRFTKVEIDIVDPPGDSGQVYGSDLYLRLTDLAKDAGDTSEPRLYFRDKFLELTVPAAAVKPTGREATTLEPAPNPGATLVPVSGAMAVRGVPVFAYASVNGVHEYKTPDGKTQTVDVGVSSNANWPGGIVMTIGTARGCGVEIEEGKTGTGVGAGFETTVAKGKVKEFRLAFRTGEGFAERKDLVLTDVTVAVDRAHSGHFVWLGTKFVNEYLADGVYACGSDGEWKLLGRVKPALLRDVTTRPPAKK